MAEYIVRAKHEQDDELHSFVERIVRCMVCRHRGTIWLHSRRHSIKWREMDCRDCEPDGFCAWGEPKEGE